MIYSYISDVIKIECGSLKFCPQIAVIMVHHLCGISSSISSIVQTLFSRKCATLVWKAEAELVMDF